MSKPTHSNNLIASIAVFAELCDSATDMQSIVTEFIKSVFVFEKTWSLNSLEVAQLLKKHFDFDLPDAVVRTCLNSLANKGLVTKKDGKYSIIDQTINVNEFSDKLSQKKYTQEQIENDLIQYCEILLKHRTTDAERKEIIDDFISYLLDGISQNYSTLISSFIIEKSQKEEFITDLNQIKEGLVLITGLRYTTDLNSIGTWNDELTIYLDTEHLFNSEGYNGEVYQKLFEDFYALVNEINLAAQKKYHKKLIKLKYFAEVKDEIESFFYVAQKIIKREDNTSPTNTAMETICQGCTSVSDIIRKKSTLESNLQTRGIVLQEELDYYSKPEYNIEDKQLIEKYGEKYSDTEVQRVLHSFTKINFLRKGQNRTSLERCQHIILTGKYISLLLSRDLEIKNEAKDIPFVTDVYFITNRFWYKLNKGLSRSDKLPSTLDIVTKAQIVLSAQVNKSLDKQYEKLKSELKNGAINKEQAQSWYYNLREEAKRPEDIRISNVQESIDFIFENDLEKYLKEKSTLEQKTKDLEKKAIQGEGYKRELDRIKALNNRRKKRPKKILAQSSYYGSVLVFIAAVLSLPVLVYYLIVHFKSEQDTMLSIFGIVLTVIIELVGLFKLLRPLHKWRKRVNHNFYLKLVKQKA